MPHLLPSCLRLLAVLLPLGLCACADTLTANDPVPSSSQLRRDYDKTLTKEEKKAVISDLQSETAKNQGEADSDETASTGAKPAQNPQ
jgi:uncharacterized membrane protein YgcG